MFETAKSVNDIDVSTDRPAVPGWAVVSALTAPLALVVSASAARAVAAAQYDPVAQTLSALVGNERSAWIITVGFVVSAASQIVTAAGLRVLRPLPRITLAIAGCCGLAVAVFPQSGHHPSVPHLAATATGATLLALWPVMTISKTATRPLVCRGRVATAATVILSMLIVWVCVAAVDGIMLGLAERVSLVAELAWPLAVVVTARSADWADPDAADPTERSFGAPDRNRCP